MTESNDGYCPTCGEAMAWEKDGLVYFQFPFEVKVGQLLHNRRGEAYQVAEVTQTGIWCEKIPRE